MNIKTEKRKSLRHLLKITPKVFFEEKNKELGSLSNINVYGFLLISDKELKEGEVYKIKITFPNQNKESEETIQEFSLESNAMCRWIKEKPNKKNWFAGFEFITPTIEHREEIEKIINKYSSNTN